MSDDDTLEEDDDPEFTDDPEGDTDDDVAPTDQDVYRIPENYDLEDYWDESNIEEEEEE